MSKKKTNSKKSKQILTLVIFAILAVYLIVTGQTQALLQIVLGEDYIQRAEPYIPAGNSALTTVFIDIGQGDSILLMSGDTKVLVDSGDPGMGKHLMERLDYYQVDSLDLVIATHPHSDHIGGLDYVLNDIPTELVMIPNYEYDSFQYNQVLDVIEENNITVKIPEVGEVFITEDLTITFLSPDPADEFDNTNEYSITCVVQGKYGNVYLGGDSEIVNEKFMLKNPVPDVDIYKASHHGSTTSNSYDFVSALSPEYAVVQCGVNNDYGHPHDEVIDTFEKLNIDTWVTSERGEIVVVESAQGIKITSER